MEKNLFMMGITISLLFHALCLAIFSLPFLNIHPKMKPLKTIEVTYRDLTPQKEKHKVSSPEDLKVLEDVKPYDDQRIKVLDKKGNLFSAFGERIKDISKMTGQLRDTFRKTAQISTLDLEKKITLPPLSTEKITNPKYLTYNDDMREAISRNIKRRAYAYVNHPDFETGEVYLTFVLGAAGDLRALKIIEGKTSANAYLREVAVRSIKESNPFPPFPKGFDYPEFTFNLLISFQN